MQQIRLTDMQIYLFFFPTRPRASKTCVGVVGFILDCIVSNIKLVKKNLASKRRLPSTHSFDHITASLLSSIRIEESLINFHGAYQIAFSAIRKGDHKSEKKREREERERTGRSALKFDKNWSMSFFLSSSQSSFFQPDDEARWMSLQV